MDPLKMKQSYYYPDDSSSFRKESGTMGVSQSMKYSSTLPANSKMGQPLIRVDSSSLYGSGLQDNPGAD